MKAGYRRLAVLLAFIGFVVGFFWFLTLDGGFLGAMIFGLILAVVGAVGSLLLGWTVRGFTSEQ